MARSPFPVRVVSQFIYRGHSLENRKTHAHTMTSSVSEKTFPFDFSGASAQFGSVLACLHAKMFMGMFSDVTIGLVTVAL